MIRVEVVQPVIYRHRVAIHPHHICHPLNDDGGGLVADLFYECSSSGGMSNRQLFQNGHCKMRIVGKKEDSLEANWQTGMLYLLTLYRKSSLEKLAKSCRCGRVSTQINLGDYL